MADLGAGGGAVEEQPLPAVEEHRGARAVEDERGEEPAAGVAYAQAEGRYPEMNECADGQAIEPLVSSLTANGNTPAAAPEPEPQEEPHP